LGSTYDCFNHKIFTRTQFLDVSECEKNFRRHVRIFVKIFKVDYGRKESAFCSAGDFQKWPELLVRGLGGVAPSEKFKGEEKIFSTPLGFEAIFYSMRRDKMTQLEL
jgi:hypothetical protein